MSALSQARPGAPRVLHIHGSFAADNPLAMRCVRLVNAFGGRLHHTLVSGDGDWSAADAIARGIAVQRRGDFPPLGGLPLPGRLQRIARAMIDYDLVLTYGRGAIGAALARTMFSRVHPLPPLIHHEDGSDETALQRRGWRSRWARRVGLGQAAGLVVPTEVMESVALTDWQQPMGRVKLIRDGVDAKAFARKAKPDGLPRLLKRPGEHWIGCFARFESADEVGALLRSMGEIDPAWHLVLVGDGPARNAIEAAVTRLALDHRVHIVPQAFDRAAMLALFDLVAITGGSEPLPRVVLEAMATGKPVTGIETGEIAASLSPDNAEYVVTDTGLPDALVRLGGDPWLRKRIGAANREHVIAERSEAAMTASYRRLYASAMRRETI